VAAAFELIALQAAWSAPSWQFLLPQHVIDEAVRLAGGAPGNTG
jgi:hypothetical protein